MNPPVDYPVIDDSKKAARPSEDMSYAALLDRHESEELITDAMIQAACLRIETAQQFPFACRPKLQGQSESNNTTDPENKAAAKVLTRLIRGSS